MAAQPDSVISKNIKDYCEKNNISVNAFFISMQLIYLYKLLGVREIILGIPVIGRIGKKNRNIMGMFVNTVPFQYKIEPSSSIQTLLREVNARLRECYLHQRYPYNHLINDLRLRDKGSKGLYEISINYYNTQLPRSINGVPVENTEFYNGQQEYSMQLIIRSWADLRFQIDFDYKLAKYTDEQINTIFVELQKQIQDMTHFHEKSIRSINYLTDNQYADCIGNFNHTDFTYPFDKTIYDLIEQQILKTPNNIAIKCEKNMITYSQLEDKINIFASYLYERGVNENSVVAILAKPNIETIVFILAILKVGGIYLPLDIKTPKERIEYCLINSNCSFLLSNIDFKSNDFPSEKIIYFNEQNEQSYFSSKRTALKKQGQFAYIIYTSGTTGQPKGVLINQKNLLNYICWAKKVYIKDEVEVFPLFTSLSFDLTVTSIYLPLISGGQMIIHNQENHSEHILSEIVNENKATVVKLTPSHLSILAGYNLEKSSIRRFIVGGEDFKTELANEIHNKFNGNIELYNEYGPTETTVGCMIYKYQFGKELESSVLIGIPADNMKIYLLDHDLQPVPIGREGHLYISGDSVGEGYINHPELTNTLFITNPFEPGMRMYKSGDIGKMNKNKDILCLGRADRQIKNHGYRIEPLEIEAVIKKHEDIYDVVVSKGLIDDYKNLLFAFIVKKNKELSNDVLIEYLSTKLPNYMVPQIYIEVDKIPLTINGKVDMQHLFAICQDTMGNNNEVYNDKKSDVLLHAASEILSFQELKMEDNFFKLGGDSIKAIQLASDISRKGFSIKVNHILSNPVFINMALYMIPIVEKRNNLVCSGFIPQTPIVDWFFSQRLHNPNYYFQSVLFDIHRASTPLLNKIFKSLIKQHDALRINYDSNQNMLFYNNHHLEEAFDLHVYDIQELPDELKEKRIIETANSIKEKIDIEKSLLFYACVFNLDNEHSQILMIAHHLVMDSVSWGIMINDIDIGISQKDGYSIFKTDSYQQWAEKLRYEAINYSQEKTNVEEIPFDFNSDEDKLSSSDKIIFTLDEKDSNRLINNANCKFNTKTSDLIAAALILSIHKMNNKNIVKIEIESNGRDTIETVDVSGTIGWFTKINEISFNITNDSLTTKIKHIKEAIRKKDCQWVGNNYKPIRLNYLGELDSLNRKNIKINRFGIGNDSDSDNILSFSIEVNCYVLHSLLHVAFTYSKNKYKQTTVEALANYFDNNLKDIIEHCCMDSGVEFTPSDFTNADLSQEELDSLF